MDVKDLITWMKQSKRRKNGKLNQWFSIIWDFILYTTSQDKYHNSKRISLMPNNVFSQDIKQRKTNTPLYDTINFRRHTIIKMENYLKWLPTFCDPTKLWNTNRGNSTIPLFKKHAGFSIMGGQGWGLLSSISQNITKSSHHPVIRVPAEILIPSQ